MATASLHLSALPNPIANLQHIRLLRYALPLALFVLATTFEAGEHWVKHTPLLIDRLGLIEILVFGIVGPFAVFITLTYVERLLQRLQQAHGAIALLNQGLEQKVAARTAELQQANQRLRSIDRMKSDFVSLVSHELRAPLATLNGGLEVALQYEAQLPPKAQRILQLLLDETARLTGFVQTILDVAQLEDGKLHLNLGPVAVKPLLHHAVDVVLGAEATRVEWQVAPDLPPVWVDEIYTEQALRNLVRNAQKYTPPASPILLTAGVDGQDLCIGITDYGPGIHPELQGQIFERFVRLPQADGDRPRGWGLGLYFAHTLLLAQNGTLTLQSPVHTDATHPGSRLVVRLPLAEAPLMEEEEVDIVYPRPLARNEKEMAHGAAPAH